jgi:predicted dehydrogenase
MPDRAEVVALCDIVPAQMAKRKASHPETCGQATEYTDYREMLAREDLDIVCLCAHGDTRLEQTEYCLARGKHLFIEKPVGYDMEEARRFQFLSLKHPDLRVAVAYTLRYSQEWMGPRAVIRSGELGDLMTCRIAYCHPHDFAEGHAESDRHYRDKAGNYIHSSELVHTTHPWDMARYLLGEVKEVFFARGAVSGSMGILWMESGCLCHVLSGSQPATKFGVNTVQYIEVHGKKGSCWMFRDLDGEKRIRCLYRVGKEGELQTAPQIARHPPSSHGGILRTHNFLDAIEGKEELICSMADGARTTELLHALWLSDRMQIKVPVLTSNHTG